MAATRTRSPGFTLVEILIVVVILGILASIVIPQFTDAAALSKSTTTAAIVRTVQAKVFESYALAGEYPPEVDNNWFVEGARPTNPLAPEQRDPLIVYEAAGGSVTHPTGKLVTAAGAFWYNSDNGMFRALVPAQGTAAATLALYNKANSADLGALSDTK